MEALGCTRHALTDYYATHHRQQWTMLAMLQNATFPAIYLLLSASFPCLVASPTMNNAGNAAKCNLSSYLLITVCQFPLFGGITNNEQRWQCCKMQPFQLFTYYCLPVSPVWWHHQQWTTLAMLQNATFPAIYLWLPVHSLLFGGISHTRTDASWCCLWKSSSVGLTDDHSFQSLEGAVC